MIKQMKIRIENSVFSANVLEDKAPKTCRMVLGLLPLRGDVFHATWSGDMLFLKNPKIPATLEPENQTVYPSRGGIGVNSTLKEIQIVYGQAQLRARFGPAPDNLFATVAENLNELEEIGRKIHREGAKKIAIDLST